MTAAHEAPARQDTCRAVRPVIDRASCEGRKHGTYAAYKMHGCRCPDARALRSRVDKRRRAGLLPPNLVPSIGTARRLQALAALGWPAEALAARLGVDHTGVCRLRAGDRQAVTRRLHHRIAVLFEQLSATPGPSQRARGMAARRGWVTPLAWGADIDDPAARPVGAGRSAVPVRVLSPCGSVAAWKRHRRRGEPVCDACREAKRVDSAEKRQQARAS